MQVTRHVRRQTRPKSLHFVRAPAVALVSAQRVHQALMQIQSEEVARGHACLLGIAQSMAAVLDLVSVHRPDFPVGQSRHAGQPVHLGQPRRDFRKDRQTARLVQRIEKGGARERLAQVGPLLQKIAAAVVALEAPAHAEANEPRVRQRAAGQFRPAIVMQGRQDRTEEIPVKVADKNLYFLANEFTSHCFVFFRLEQQAHDAARWGRNDP